MENKTYNQNRPLADKMRPENLNEFIGQEHLVGEGKVLRKAIENNNLPSMIFWGPPGSGKTTLAKIIANSTNSKFVELTAVSSGVAEIRKIMKDASERHPVKTILFIDEIHRFNKAQQDIFLPYVENGVIILIGATTENPGFEVNSALLSRARVFVLNLLESTEIEIILKNAITDKNRGLGNLKINIKEEIIKYLANLANGDARAALNALELAVSISNPDKNGAINPVRNSSQKLSQAVNRSTGQLNVISNGIKIDEEIIKEALQKTHLLYDKSGEEHYNLISAFHKSMRGGDADASLYWLVRMLEAGEEPLYIARRLIRFASEDIGIANSLALPQAVAAYQACHYIGMPECNVNLAQAAVYMAKSKKSNALYTAYNAAREDVKNLPNEPVPLHLRNAPTKLMKNLGYGKDYKYTPDLSADKAGYKNEKEASQNYLPEKLKGRKYLKE